jgi:cytochrome c oxidase assembly factor 3, fungi type
MSPGLKRAREPYRVKNAIVGLTLGAFAVAIWAYSISAVKQDVFDDVDEEARAMASSAPDLGVGAHINSEATKGKTVSPSSIILEEVAKAEKSKWGVLHYLDKRLPWLLDPERKTLVWGAPPVDNPGKIWKP